MSTQREWTTIREYDDILFDYYNGIARITINVIGMHSPRLLLPK